MIARSWANFVQAWKADFVPILISPSFSLSLSFLRPLATICHFPSSSCVGVSPLIPKPVTGDAATMLFCTFVAGGFTCTYFWHARFLTFAFVQYAVGAHHMWFTTGLAFLASCRFPFFTPSQDCGNVLHLQHLGIFRQLFAPRIQRQGEVALRSVLAGRPHHKQV